MYHQPLRLTVMIHAPINRIVGILERNSHLKSLLDNEWIYLMVMDPEQKNEVFKYKKTLIWESASSNKASGAQRALNTSTLTELAV